MWTEKMKNGKVRFVERYIEPLTGQTKKVSVVLDKIPLPHENRLQRSYRHVSMMLCPLRVCMSSKTTLP